MGCTGRRRRVRRPARWGRHSARRSPAPVIMAIVPRIIAGRDDQDAALLAWPVEWGETGMMSFMWIDLHDTVYQANLGEESAAKAQAITRFAPDADAGWQVVKP